MQVINPSAWKQLCSLLQKHYFLSWSLLKAQEHPAAFLNKAKAIDVRSKWIEEMLVKWIETHRFTGVPNYLATIRARSKIKREMARGRSGSWASSRTPHHHRQFWRNSSRLSYDDSKMSWAVAAQSSLEGKKFICTKPPLQLSTERRITSTRKSELLPAQYLCLWVIIT